MKITEKSQVLGLTPLKTYLGVLHLVVSYMGW